MGLEEGKRRRIRNEYKIGLCSSTEEAPLRVVCGLSGGRRGFELLLAFRNTVQNLISSVSQDWSCLV